MFVALSPAETIEVPADHATISAAISAAEDGDDIRISAGTYLESDLLLQSRESAHHRRSGCVGTAVGHHRRFGHLLNPDGIRRVWVRKAPRSRNIVFTGSVGQRRCGSTTTRRRSATASSPALRSMFPAVRSGQWIPEAVFEVVFIHLQHHRIRGKPLLQWATWPTANPGPTLRTSLFCGECERTRPGRRYLERWLVAIPLPVTVLIPAPARRTSMGTARSMASTCRSFSETGGICGFCPADLNRDGCGGRGGPHADPRQLGVAARPEPQAADSIPTAGSGTLRRA